MSYDPNFPPTNAELISAEWRAQFHGIMDVVNAQAATITALAARVAALEAGSVTLPQVQAAVDAGVATCARNPSTVSPPSVAASDPPTQSEVQGGFDFSANLHTALLRT